MYYVIDESSFRIDKTSFPSAEEAEARAGEAARIVGRAVNVYALQAGELNFAFRVLPCGTVEETNPLTEPQAGGQEIEPAGPVALGVFDRVAEALETAGQVKLAAAVDQQATKVMAARKFYVMTWGQLGGGGTTVAGRSLDDVLQEAKRAGIEDYHEGHVVTVEAKDEREAIEIIEADLYNGDFVPEQKVKRMRKKMGI